jgi:hypothetical protein
MATVTRPTDALPDSGDALKAEPIRDHITNILTFLESNNIDSSNVDYSSTDGIMVLDRAQTVTGAKNFSATILLSGSAVVDLNGIADSLVLDEDGDTTISSPTDDQIDIEVGGADLYKFTATAFVSGSNLVSDTTNTDSLGTTALTWSDLYLGDSSVLAFGEDQDVTLTHDPDDGIFLNAGMKLAFRDMGGEYIYSVADGTLGIAAASEVDITTTTLDVNGAMEVSGTLNLGASTAVANVKDEDNMSSNSATSLSTQQSIKAYVDSQIATADTLAELTDTNITSAADASMLLYDTGTSTWIDNVMSGDATMADTGAVTFAGTNTNLTTLANVTTVGTIGTGAWESSTVVASAYLDAQTAHLNVTQSFTGAKTFGAGTQFNSTVTVGANDSGYDVILYGNAASANVTWDASVDDLIFNGAARIIVPNGQLVLGSVALSSTASELNLLDALDRGSIIYGNASGATTVLGQGVDGTVLTSDGTDISWSATAAASGDVTGITSVINAALALGRDADNQIKFGTDDQIVFEVAGGDGVTFKASGEIEATSLDISGDADIGGTSQFNSTVTVGANDSGYDVILYGNAASANVTWDASVDDMIFNGAARLIVPNGQLVVGSVALTSTASELNLLDALDRGSIIYGNASGATTVLGQGADGTVLTSDGDDISWEAAASSGHTIQEEGSGLTSRANLNFVGAAVTATDNGSDTTIVTVTPTGASMPLVREADGSSDPITLTSAAVGDSLVSDTSPQLGGNLDVLARSITTTTTNGNIAITPHGTGKVVLDTNLTFDGTTLAVTGALTMANAAGPTIVNEAATATNPTLIPNKAEVDTGFGWGASDSLTAITGGTERMRIDANGDITMGGGTGNYSTAFLPSGFSNFSNVDQTYGSQLELGRSTNADATWVGVINFVNPYNTNAGNGAGGSGIAQIIVESQTTDSNAGDDSGGHMLFYTKAEAAGSTESMRIDSAGNVGIGTASPADALHIYKANPKVILDSNGAGYPAYWFYLSGTAKGGMLYDTANNELEFYTNGTGGGDIRLKIDSSGDFTGSSSADISDARLKENVVELTGCLAQVNALRGVSYNFLPEANKNDDLRYGLLAQEVEAVIPAIVWDKSIHDVEGVEGVEAADAVLYVEGDEIPEGENIGDVKTPAVEAVEAVEAASFKSLHYTGLIPVFIEAIKELTARITALESA